MSSRMLNFFAILCVSMGISGCGTTLADRLLGYSAPESITPGDWNAFSKAVFSSRDVGTANALLASQYSKVISICVQVANYYERTSRYGDGTRLSVGLVGAVAGGVVAPVLAAAGVSAAAVAAFGGVAGVSSSFLSTYNDTLLGPQASLALRTAVIKTATDARQTIHLASNASELPVKVEAVIDLYFSCKIPQTPFQQDIDSKNFAAAFALGASSASAADKKKAVAATPASGPAGAAKP
jgi:hypothetical protein